MLTGSIVGYTTVILRERCEIFSFDLFNGLKVGFQRLSKRQTYLDNRDPIPVKYAFAHKFLNVLRQRCIHSGRLRANLCDKGIALLLISAFFKENLGCLGKDGGNEKFDHLSTEIRGRGVKEVLVDVGKHPRASSEVIECALQALWIRSALGCGDG